MHPELESMLEQAAPAPRRAPDIGAIVSGGRRLRAQRRLMRLVTAVGVVGALGVSVPALMGAFESVEPVPPAGPGKATEPFREVEPIPRRQVYVDREVGEGKELIGGKKIVAAGKVLGERWSMVEYVTTENRPREDQTHCVEFFLGKDGLLGGGGDCATPKHDDSLLTLSGQYWADAPDVVAIIGSVAEPAVSARVELADGRSRTLEIIRSYKDDTVGWYVFFPPPFEEGRVVALDANGGEVGSRPICFPIDARTGEFSMEPVEHGNSSCSQ